MRGIDVTDRRKILDLSGKVKKKKKLSLVQAYTKLFWKSKLEAIIQDEWRNDWLQRNPGYDEKGQGEIPKPKLDFRNKVISWLWEQESLEIKTKVGAFRNQKSTDGETSDEEGLEDGLDPEEVKRRKLVAERQRYDCYRYRSVCCWLLLNAFQSHRCSPHDTRQDPRRSPKPNWPRRFCVSRRS